MISSPESKESKFFQKAISVFLSALLVVAFIPAVAFADVSDNAGYASSQEDGGYKVDISGSTVIGKDNSGAGEGANTDNSQNNSADLAGNEPNSEPNSESSSATDSAEDSVAVQSQGGQGQPEDAMSSWRFANGQLETVYADEDNGIEMYSSRAGNGSPVAKGIDVSSWQGNIDWNTVKNSGQVDFVIIRCGWGNNDSSQNDAYWLRNASECKRLGIPFGVYIYSYACNTSYAVSEADHVLAQLNAAGLSPSQVAYPIYLDLEQQSKSNNRPCGIDNWNNEVLLSNGDLANIAQAFCNRIASAGYTPGIYANLNWWNNYLTSSVFDNYERWVAQYNSSCWYEGNYSLWQYASDGTVPGISGYVDMNYDYGIGTKDLSDALIKYRTHVSKIGWTNYKGDGESSGTTGRSLPIEAFQVELGGKLTSQYSGGVQYRGYIQDIGWENGWKSDGAMSGTSGQAKRLEAIQVKLTGDLANKYDVYYRVHAQEFGWLGWAKNGEQAGTAGYSYRLEAIQIQVVPKGSSAPGSTDTPFKTYQVEYTTHVQDIGWQDYAYDGSMSGTSHQSKRLEGIRIKLASSVSSQGSGSIQYRTHIQDIGWENGWKSDGAMSGTSGQAKRLEAIQVKLTGDLANKYDVYYRVHAQEFGWLGWAKNGEQAGTAGYSYRLEAIQIQVVPKGSSAPGSTDTPFRTR